MAISAADKARSGTKEWLFQRITNALICVWAIITIVLFIDHQPSNLADFSALLAPIWYKALSSVVLVLGAFNSVLAGWQISTDYVKGLAINLIFNLLVRLVTLVYLVAGMYVLWGLS
ncbi:succinate dehydrogenase, hydrophobic membrane anchor protein [Marinomonas posidonica]|uniref:succinate dehydrogenase, hydrophobic membrane anchor protein n=1 Tax=Marinomonas posidonica TaxID=936476 RepID=UPI003736D554